MKTCRAITPDGTRCSATLSEEGSPLLLCEQHAEELAIRIARRVRLDMQAVSAEIRKAAGGGQG
jgi:hypothetical protein